MQSSSFVWASSFIHCLAALDFGADVEQPFNCLIVQNRQAVEKSMDWILEDDMVDGLFFCATHRPQRRPCPNLYKQERKRPTPVRRRLSRTQALLRRVIRRGVYRCLEVKCRVLWGCPRSVDTAMLRIKPVVNMGVRRNFSRGHGKVDILLVFFSFLAMQRKWTYTKNVQCYDNGYIQRFPYKKILHWENVCFSENGYFKTELAEF